MVYKTGHGSGPWLVDPRIVFFDPDGHGNRDSSNDEDLIHFVDRTRTTGGCRKRLGEIRVPSGDRDRGYRIRGRGGVGERNRPVSG